MPIGISQRFATGGVEDYEAVHKALDIANDPPDGLLVHSAGPVHDGWGVTDFWESREKFDAFVEGRLRPAMMKLESALGRPDVREFPVHNLERF